MSALIYLVDDEPLLLEILSQYLSKGPLGWKVECFSTPSLAIEAAGLHHPDIVISDLAMPEMSGVAMLELVRQVAPHSIRILVSGYADPKAIGNQLSSAHQYLGKPFSLPDIRAKIKKALGSLAQFQNDEIRGTVLSIRTLPAMPQIYYELLSALENPDSSYSEVADILSKDAAISARILQMANSPFFRETFDDKSTIDLFQAIAILGTERIKAAALSHQQFSKTMVIPDYFNPGGLANHRWETANLSFQLATSMNLSEEQARNAFVAGLMHDMGRLVLLDNFQSAYHEACQRALSENKTLVDIEQETFKMSQADVVGFLVSLWGMHDSISQTIIYQDKPWLAPTPEIAQTATALYAAHYKAHLAHPSEKFQQPALNTQFLEEQKVMELLGETVNS